MAAVASTVASCARAASSARVPSRRDGPGRLSRAAPAGAKSARGGSVVPSAFTPAGAKIAGVGMELPAQSLTNDDLASLVDTNDEWIRTRTGIGKRHVISGDESLTSLASGAAKKALTMANVDAEDVDVIILATSSPDDAFGSACTVQAEIGATGALAYDLTAACSGFVVGMVNAVHFLRGGEYQHVLVIGADALSRYVDWRDRGTCILFGDGAGACVLSKTDDPNDCCLLGFDMHSDGTGNGNLTAAFVSESNTEKTAKPTSESQTAASAVGAFANVQMNGQEVFKFAVRAVPDTLTKSLAKAGVSAEEIDHLVLHQANQRIIDGAAKKFGLGKEKVVSNIEKYGNTSAGSVPIAMAEAVAEGRIKPGDVVATAGFGAGLTWASAIFRW
jgi:3-oxoacyl-[acyl-carrier-protein] synthase-3